MGVLITQREDISEGVWISGIVSVDEDVSGGEFGLVFQDGGFEFAEFFEDEGALFAAGEFDAVDCDAGFYCGVVGWGEGAGEEGVEEGGFAGGRGAEDVGEEDVAVGSEGAFGAAVAFAGGGEVEGGCGGVVGGVVA